MRVLITRFLGQLFGSSTNIVGAGRIRRANVLEIGPLALPRLSFLERRHGADGVGKLRLQLAVQSAECIAGSWAPSLNCFQLVGGLRQFCAS